MNLMPLLLRTSHFDFMVPVSLYISLKLDRLKSDLIVTRELIPLFNVESANQYSLQSVQSPLLRGLQYSILP